MLAVLEGALHGEARDLEAVAVQGGVVVLDDGRDERVVLGAGHPLQRQGALVLGHLAKEVPVVTHLEARRGVQRDELQDKVAGDEVVHGVVRSV